MQSKDKFQTFLPWTGLIAAAAMIVGIALSGSDLPDDATRQTILAHYDSGYGKALIAHFVTVGLFSAFFLFFATALRANLRSGEASESIYSTLAQSGAIVLAASIAIDGMVVASAYAAADRGLDEATVALHTLGSYAFMPWMVGAAALFIAVGLGGLRTSTLPKWFAWITLVMGILCFTPGGIAVYLVQPIWLVAAAVILIRRWREPVAQVA